MVRESREATCNKKKKYYWRARLGIEGGFVLKISRTINVKANTLAYYIGILRSR